MDEDENDIAAHARRTPPACVKLFRLTPAQLPKPFDDNVTTVW